MGARAGPIPSGELLGCCPLWRPRAPNLTALMQVFIPKESLPGETRVAATPETVARRVREYEEALGNTHLVVRMQFPGTDPERVMESIRLLAEEVAPKFRDEGTPSS